MRFVRYILVAVGAVGAMIIVDGGHEIVHRVVVGKARYATEASLEIPGTSRELVLERRAIHLFLAEYERTLILRDGEGEILRRTLAVDTGGLSRLELYSASKSEFILKGAHSADRYLLNISTGSMADGELADSRTDGTFVGAFDRDEQGWRFIPVAKRGEELYRFERAIHRVNHERKN